MRKDRTRALVVVAALGMLTVTAACASDRPTRAAPESQRMTEPVPMRIMGTSKPIPTEIMGTPTVQLAGTPTVQLAEKGQRGSWEYSILEAGTDMTVVIEQLNQLGKQGWEVIAGLPGGRASTILLLKRRG